MALFQNYGSKLSKSAQDRVENAVALFKTPKGDHAQRVNSLATYYIIAVFVVTIGGLSVISAKGYMAIILLVAGFMAASVTVQHHVLPVLYGLLAPKMGWPSWEEGWRLDETKRAQVAPSAAPVAAAAAPDPAPESPARKVLGAWAALEAERRKARALDVVKHLQTLPNASAHWQAVVDLPEGPARDEMAASMLSLAAKAEGIAA